MFNLYPDTQTIQTMTLPLTQGMLETAQKFAAGEIPPQKQEQIFNNTLAVAVVNSYLEMMEFPTALSAGDSWHPLLRLCSDVADLALPEMGHLECRPFDPSTHRYTLPLDLPEDRIGLVAVELDCANRAAKLLGFTPSLAPGAELSLAHLRSLEEMLSYLEHLEKTTVRLSQWLEGVYNAGWQTVDALVGNARWNFALGFMSDPIQLQPLVGGAKLVDLGLNLGHQPVLLLLTVTQLPDGQFEIRVQLHPSAAESVLPAQVRLVLLSDAGEELREVTARDADNLIQLPRFKCALGEQFGIQVQLAQVCVQQFFMI